MQIKTVSVVDNNVFRTAVVVVDNSVVKIRTSFYNLFFSIKKIFKREKSFESNFGVRESNKKRYKTASKKILKILIALSIVMIIIYGGVLLATRSSSSNPTVVDEKIKVQGAKSSQDINKEFTFPLKDNSGEEISSIKYTVEKAELKDEIIVKGKKAVAVEGRTFLILTIKIKNEYKSPVEIKTRDYVRLAVNGNENEWLAAEIHNDPVDVQAISTKYTRLGFAINDSDKNLVLRVGEINGDKERIELNL